MHESLGKVVGGIKARGRVWISYWRGKAERRLTIMITIMIQRVGREQMGANTDITGCPLGEVYILR